MADLRSDLSEAVSAKERAARLASPGAWGEVCSAEHGRYSVPKVDRRRGFRWCSWCERAGHDRMRNTHTGMANGGALTSGCEWHMARWVRDGYEGLPLR